MLRRWTFLSSLMIALIAAIVAWQRWRELQTLSRERLEIRNEIARLARRSAQLRQTRAKMTPPPAPAKTANSSETLHEYFDKRSREGNEAVQNELLSQPGLQLLHEQNARARFEAQFAAFFRERNFTPAQKEAFVTSLVKFDMLDQDLTAIAREKGLSPNDSELKAKRAAAETESIREVEALLGPDALSLTREYTRLDLFRRYVAEYAGLFSQIGEPMSFEQIETLTAALGKIQTKSNYPGDFTSAEWARVSAEAQRVLTPAQWREFQISVPPHQMGSPWETAVKEALAKAGAPEKN